MTKYPIFKVHVDKEAALKELDVVLGSGFLNEGEQVTRLTKELSAYLEHDKAVVVNSCTSALTLALVVAGVKPGDYVIASPMTCLAGNTPIYDVGARIIWCDIDAKTGNMDPKKLKEILSVLEMDKPIKAVMAVDWAGMPCDWKALREICDFHKVKLIQDAAHAFGAKLNGKHVCHYPHFTCYSMQAIKHITCGDGGIIVCENEEDFKRVKKLKWFGIDREATKDAKGEWKGQRWEIDIEEAGFKFHMNNIAAAIGLSQIPHIKRIVGTHQVNAMLYETLFETHQIGGTPLKYQSNAEPAFWVYTLLLDEDIDRDAVLEYMNKEGIAAGVVHIPNHNYTCFKRDFEPMPQTDYFAKHQISLPCGWWLNGDDILFIFNTLDKAIIHARKNSTT